MSQPHGGLARAAQASAILATITAHAITKGPGLLPEMLWACHVAAFAMAIGILADRPRLVAMGLLFHIGQGTPAYLLEVLVLRETTLTSFLSHAVPIAMGTWRIAETGLPDRILLPAWLLYVVALLASYGLTPAALNVNLAHAPWPPVAALFPYVWMSWSWNLAASAVTLFIAERLLRAWDRRRPRRSARRPPADREARGGRGDKTSARGTGAPP